MNDSRTPIRFGLTKPLLIAVGLTPSRSYLALGPNVVHVRMGWAFHADLPWASIRRVRPAGRALSIGVHGWRGRWLVNGATGPLVALTVEPPVRARALGFPIRLHELTVSLDDPDSFVRRAAPMMASLQAQA
jgi:hypothetical protein